MTFLGSTEFRTDLQTRVQQYFEQRQLSQHASAAMRVKTAVLLIWLSGSYAALVFWASCWWQAIPLAVSLGLAMAGVGFNIQHDGNHGAYSERAWVNRVMAYTLNLLGGNAYFWYFKHNIAHHTYPNVSGADEDIDIGVLGRLSPHDRRRWFHRFQHLYVWMLYALLAIQWHLYKDFKSLVQPRFGDTRAPRPRGWNHAMLWIGKAAFFALAFALPLALHSVGAVIGTYVLAAGTLGLTLSIVFQLAHCVEEATFRMPATPAAAVDDGGRRRIDREWAAHQVETTVDFARGNRLVTWYLGGLNYQIEHHLFPKICHVHYPALSPIVEQVCADHGIRHFSHPTMLDSLRSHFRWLRRLGAAA